MTEMVNKKGHTKGYGIRAFAIGAYSASNGLQAAVIGYLTYYLTDSALLGAGVVGAMIACAKIIDLITDFVAGFIIDHTHSKWGKARPYSIASIFMWAALVLLFSVPESLSSGMKITYAFVMYLLTDSVFRTLLTSSEPVHLRRGFNDKEQIDVIGSSGLIAGLISMVGNAMLPTLIANFESQPHGWTIITLIMAVPCGLLGLTKLFFVPERYGDAQDKTNDYGAENTLSVVADNSKLPNSRWYTGSGIYRPVWLHIGGEQHVEYQGVKITTVSINPAKIKVETKSTDNISVEILDSDTVVAAGSGAVCEIEIPNAKLWSDVAPNLYTCRVTVGEDVVEEKFGIRTIEWSPKGLFINGKKTLLRGGCVHHDNGIVGAATYDESEWRRVRILKEAGFNAIRSAHNPTSRAMLEACDYYGMYMMDETFDTWYNRKNKYDYGCDFEECWAEDTAAMVNRDYNHPSVIMYSIGNEVAEPGEAKGLDYGKKQVELIHSIDSTRPVTCGLNLMVMSRAAKGQGIYQDGEQTIGAGSPPKEEKVQNGSLAFNRLYFIQYTQKTPIGEFRPLTSWRWHSRGQRFDPAYLHHES